MFYFCFNTSCVIHTLSTATQCPPLYSIQRYDACISVPLRSDIRAAAAVPRRRKRFVLQKFAEQFTEKHLPNVSRFWYNSQKFVYARDPSNVAAVFRKCCRNSAKVGWQFLKISQEVNQKAHQHFIYDCILLGDELEASPIPAGGRRRLVERWRERCERPGPARGQPQGKHRASSSLLFSFNFSQR